MGRIPRLFMVAMLLTACASPPPPERISRSRWIECWTLCGKKDNLTAVTSTLCLCKGGYTISRDEKNSAEESTDKTEPVELFDWLLK